MEAEVTLRYNDVKTADAIAKAVAPDNFKTPTGLQITTDRKGESVITQVRSKGSFATFIATLDDLLFCVSTAEKAIETAKKLE